MVVMCNDPWNKYEYIYGGAKWLLCCLFQETESENEMLIVGLSLAICICTGHDFARIFDSMSSLCPDFDCRHLSLPISAVCLCLSCILAGIMGSLFVDIQDPLLED